MMARFRDVFGKDAFENKKIPQEVIDALNAEIPDCFSYFQHNGKVAIGLKDGIRTFIADIKFRYETEADKRFVERLSALPKELYAEYIYRTQRSIPVEVVSIGSRDTKAPIEKLMGDPLSDEKITLNDCRMYPEQFPDPVPVLFETVGGQSATIRFQQQAYDSFTELLFGNVDFPALKIEAYVYSPLTDQITEADRNDMKTDGEHPVCFSCTVAPVKAATTEDALTALYITKGIMEGTVRLNGREVKPDLKADDASMEMVVRCISFWETAVKLEWKLGVRFEPGADFPTEDERLFTELDICLNRQQRIAWEHPFSSFHVSNAKPGTGLMDPDSLIGQEKLEMSFREGPISCSLLGAKFDIYSDTTMSNFVITGIDWEDEEKKSGEVHIADTPGETWVLERLYKAFPDGKPD